MSEQKTYCKTLSDVANVLQIPYTKLYKNKHRPEFIKSARGYNVKKISQFFIDEETKLEEEEKEKNLLQIEDELLEKQIKLETARHKCRLLELQIKQKEGNLIDVNFVLETRTKEILLLRKRLQDMVKNLPIILKNQDEAFIREKINVSVNDVLSELSEFIIDDWETNEEEQELDNEQEQD